MVVINHVKEGPLTPLLVNMFFDTGNGAVPVLGVAEGEEVSCSVVSKNVGIMLIVGPAAGAELVPILMEGDNDSCLLLSLVVVAGGVVIELIIGALEEGGGIGDVISAAVDALDSVPVQSLTASLRSSIPDMVGALVVVVVGFC